MRKLWRTQLLVLLWAQVPLPMSGGPPISGSRMPKEASGHRLMDFDLSLSLQLDYKRYTSQMVTIRSGFAASPHRPGIERCVQHPAFPSPAPCACS